MTSSERIKASICHQEPDRVPMHINASARVVERLLQHLGLSTVRELMEYLHIDVYDTRGMDLHSGTAPIYIGSGKGDKKSPDHPLLKPGKSWGGNIMSLWNIREYEKDSIHGPVLEIENPLLTDPSDWEQWENYLWPSVSWFDYSEINADLLKWSEFSIMASGASVFQHGSYIRGLDAQLMDLLMAPDKAEYLLDKLFDFYFDYYSKLFASCGEQIDVFALADDFGTQNSLMISEALFDQYFASRIKKLADLAHKHDIFLLLHTCGNIEPLIPSFIDLGVDVLDPVQPESMDVVQIKKKYGKDICLRGGISSQKVLAHGSKEDVQQEVKEKLDILMPGGGYIFSPGHPVFQVDIPTENIVTMYETAWGVNGEK